MKNNCLQVNSRMDFLLSYAYKGLCIIVFCNLNAMMAMTVGIKSLLTPFLLLFSTVVVGRYVFYRKNIINSRILIFIFLLLASYIYFSIISHILFPENLHHNTSLIKLFRNYLSSFLVIGAFYYGTIYTLQINGIKYLLKFLLILFLIASIFTAFTNDLGVANLYVYASDSLREGSRQAGLFGNPNEAGNFGAYFLVLLLTGVLIFKKYKVAILSLILLAIYSILVSFSKAAIGISIFVLIVYLLFNLKNILKVGAKNRKIFIITFGIIFGLVYWTFINWNNIYNSLDQGQKKRALSFFLLLQGEVSSRTTSDRTITFQQGWQMIKESPIIGNGFGSFHRFKEGEIQLGVHNTYLLLIGEGGIFPLFLFCILPVLIIKNTFLIREHGLRFFILGFCIVFFLSVAAMGHNALYDRVSNGMLGIATAIITYKRAR